MKSCIVCGKVYPDDGECPFGYDHGMITYRQEFVNKMQEYYSSLLPDEKFIAKGLMLIFCDASVTSLKYIRNARYSESKKSWIDIIRNAPNINREVLEFSLQDYIACVLGDE